MQAAPSDSASALVILAQREHEGALRRYATRLLHDEARARDVVQETLLALGRSTDAELETLRPRLAAWLFTVCRRKALNILRAEGRLSPLDSAPAALAPEADPAAALERADTRHHLLALVERLPERQREVVRLRYQEGFSYQEISDITSHTVSHVGVLLHTALQTLRRAWPVEPVR